MYDADRVREDFPILSRRVHQDKPLVYLDNASTSQKPRRVIDALSHYYEHYNSNVHRGIHTLSEQASDEFEDARERIASFIGAGDPNEVIFVRNATEALNLVAQAWGRANVGSGDEIVLSEMEHHSNLVPWQLVAREKGADLKYFRVDDNGEIDPGQIDELIGERTKVVSITHMSNVLGTINPVELVAKRAHDVGAVLVVDGAQSVPHLPVDVAELGCDFLAFSGHKMLGPMGAGVLWGRTELLEAMGPFLGGGSMIREVFLDHSTWNELPWKFEAGTPDVADVIGLAAAVDYLDSVGMDAIRQHEMEMASYAISALTDLDGVTVYGPRDPSHRGGVVAFNYLDIHPHDIGTIVDREGVAIRAGHHCCQPLMRRLGVAATCRASYYLYNTESETDVLVAALKQARELFGSVAV
jgi:cysteine desulfurase/selenocysteine lyase